MKKRVLSFIMALVMVVTVIPTGVAFGDEPETGREGTELESSTIDQVLTEGKYYVRKDTTITASAAGVSGIKIADKAEVEICIDKGATLTVKGADGIITTDADGNPITMPGGAGIWVPEGSELTLSGEGTLNARGGKASNGLDGEYGGIKPAEQSGSFIGRLIKRVADFIISKIKEWAKKQGWTNDDTNNVSIASVGGAGGNGGGGAGAGIGTPGAAGAAGGLGGFVAKYNDDIINPIDGETGEKSTKAKKMGTLIVKGVTVNAIGGEAGQDGRGGGCYPEAEGAGGGAGAGGYAAAKIGCGGNSGAGGGGGGAIGNKKNEDTGILENYDGAMGGKGAGKNESGNGEDIPGDNCSMCGEAGTSGKTGDRQLFKIEYKGCVSTSLSPKNYYYGDTEELPIPSQSGYIFDGWYTDETLSTKVTAIAATDCGNKTFYANWIPAGAIIGTQMYPSTKTLEEIIEAAEGGATIQLLKDFELSTNIIIDKDLTLNLYGHTISLAENFTRNSTDKLRGLFNVKRGATLTINDSVGNGEINAIAGNVTAEGEENKGLYSVIQLTIPGEENTEGKSEVVVNAGSLTGYYYGITGNGGRHNTAITITGGIVEGTKLGDSAGIYNPQNGTVDISGGEVRGFSALYIKAGEANISGSAKLIADQEAAVKPYGFNGNGANITGDAIIIDNCGYPGGYPKVTIKNGPGTSPIITSAKGKAVAAYIPTDDKTAAVAESDYTPAQKDKVFDSVNISGGLFSSEISKLYCAEDCVPAPLDEETRMYSVKPGNFVAQVGKYKFESLAEALEAVKADETIKTITLLANCTLSTNVHIDKDITLDLAGYKISLASDFNKPDSILGNALFNVKRGATLTINDKVGTGKIDARGNSKMYAVVALTVKGESPEAETEENLASVVVNGGHLIGHYYGITGNGLRNGTSITINDGIVEGTNTNEDLNSGIYNPQQGTVTINGGVVKGYSALYIKSGTATITGGELIANGTSAVPYKSASSGANITGDAIIIDNCGYPGGYPIVTIENGPDTYPTITSESGKAVAAYIPTSTTPGAAAKTELTEEDKRLISDSVDISGGSFSTQVDELYCAKGYIPAPFDEDTGMYSVKTGYYVAQVGETKYETFEEALTAVKENGTITLLAEPKSPKNPIVATVTKSFIIDGNDITLKNGIKLDGNGENTIKVMNVTFNQKGLDLYGFKKMYVYDNKFYGINQPNRVGFYDAILVENGEVADIFNNTIDDAKEVGIDCRDIKVEADVWENIVENTAHNSLQIVKASHGYMPEASVKGNVFGYWGCCEIPGKSDITGRAFRGQVASLDFNENKMINNNAPEEFVKLTDTPTGGSIDVSRNYWSRNNLKGEDPSGTFKIGTEEKAYYLGINEEKKQVEISCYYTDVEMTNLVNYGYIAKIGNTLYSTLLAAIQAVETGDVSENFANIELIAECDETINMATVTKSFTITGRGNKLTGDITLKGNGRNSICIQDAVFKNAALELDGFVQIDVLNNTFNEPQSMPDAGSINALTVKNAQIVFIWKNTIKGGNRGISCCDINKTVKDSDVNGYVSLSNNKVTDTHNDAIYINNSGYVIVEKNNIYWANGEGINCIDISGPLGIYYNTVNITKNNSLRIAKGDLDKMPVANVQYNTFKEWGRGELYANSNTETEPQVFKGILKAAINDESIDTSTGSEKHALYAQVTKLDFNFNVMHNADASEEYVKLDNIPNEAELDLSENYWDGADPSDTLKNSVIPYYVKNENRADANKTLEIGNYLKTYADTYDDEVYAWITEPELLNDDQYYCIYYFDDQAILKTTDGHNYLMSLQDAVWNAYDGDTVILQKDVNNYYDIIAVTEVTIDLNGKKVYFNDNKTLQVQPYYDKESGEMWYSGKVTIKNGTLEANSPKGNAIVSVWDECSLILDNVTINQQSSEGYALATNGECTIGTFTIKDNCTIYGKNYFPADGKYVIEGGEFTSLKETIRFRGGEIDISGGTFTSSTCDAVIIEGASGYSKPVANITGGTFNPETNDGLLINEYDGYEVDMKGTDVSYKLQKYQGDELKDDSRIIAHILDDYENKTEYQYSSFDDALSELKTANGAQTVKLLTDIQNNYTILNGDEWNDMLDLNGYTLTTTATACFNGLVEDSKDGKGLLKTGQNTIAFSKPKRVDISGVIPIWSPEDSGYRFYHVERVTANNKPSRFDAGAWTTNASGKDMFKLWNFLRTQENWGAVLSDSAIGMEITYYVNGNPVKTTFDFNEGTLNSYAEAAEKSQSTTYLYVTFNKSSAVTGMSVTPYIKGNNAGGWQLTSAKAGGYTQSK